MRILNFTALGIMALCCSGCWPAYTITSPGAMGTVVDRDSRQPVAGASVAVSRTARREWPNYGVPTAEEALTNTRPPLVTTGADGKFLVPPEKKWGMTSTMADEHAEGTLVVRKEGYKSATYPLVQGLDDDVGKIVLTPGMDRP